jgi:hypothetical protein
MIYSRIWKLQHAESLDELIDIVSESSDELNEMRNCGIILELSDDFYVLHTKDQDVAQKFNFKEAHVLEQDLAEKRKEKLKKFRDEAVKEMRKSVAMMRKIRFPRK